MSFKVKNQIMSKDKYPNLFFLLHMGAIVFIILQKFFAASMVLKIGKYHPDIPQFYFGNI